MAKTGIITLRVEAEAKQRLETAASRKGQSLTTFMLTAAENAARRSSHLTETQTPTVGRHNGVPTFFRARCLEASRGGASGYHDAGYHLASSVGTLQADDLKLSEWEACLDQLRDLALAEDEAGVLGWFDQHYPSCMQLVPQRRRTQFVQGVYQAREAERI